MNVYDSAHLLAKAIKESSEYKEFVEKQKKVVNNPKTKEMMKDFREKALEIQMAQMSGQKIEPQKMENIKKLENIVMSNPVIKEFFMVEMRFSQMMNDINKIIGDSIDIKLDSDK